VGIFLGFSFTTVLNKQGTWEWAFYIQAILCIPGILGIIATDSKFFDIDGAVAFRNKCQKKVLKELNLPENFLAEKQPATRRGGVLNDPEEKEENISKLQQNFLESQSDNQ